MLASSGDPVTVGGLGNQTPLIIRRQSSTLPGRFFILNQVLNEQMAISRTTTPRASATTGPPSRRALASSWRTRLALASCTTDRDRGDGTSKSLLRDRTDRFDLQRGEGRRPALRRDDRGLRAVSRSRSRSPRAEPKRAGLDSADHTRAVREAGQGRRERNRRRDFDLDSIRERCRSRGTRRWHRTSTRSCSPRSRAAST